MSLPGCMTEAIAPIEALRDFTRSLPTSGELSAEERDELIRYLAASWDYLIGTSDQNTFSTKLDRAESISWNPPVLGFTLERHGGTVHGSSRAELHHWEVNLETGEAWIAGIGNRQIHTQAKRLDTRKLAQETARRIISGEDHPSLQWPAPGTRVVIAIAELIPETNRQTTAARRNRFRTELERLMNEAGWVGENKGNKTGFRKA